MLKKLLIPFFLVFLVNSNTAQIIQNISYQPPYPGPLDSVTVYIDLQFNSGGCALEYGSHSISGDTIRINLHHCPGALTVICNVTDTIELGTLASGNYFTEVIVSVSDPFSPDPCTNPVPADSGDIQITVLPGTGIDKTKTGSINLHFDSDSRVLIFKNNPPEGSMLALYNINGSIVLQTEVPASGFVKTPAISKGVYFYRLYEDKKELTRGKILID